MNQPPIRPLDYPSQLLFALSVTLALGWPVGLILRAIERSIVVPKPARISDDQWNLLTTIPGRVGGSWIGHIERFLFFVSITAALPELAVGWLAFKVASKWEAWGNVYKIPPKLARSTEFEWFLARTRWGSRTFQRSLIGTGANLAAAIIGATLFYLGVRAKHWL